MRNYTVENPTFTKAISIVEEDDLVNEENDTAAAKQLIANDLVLNDRIEQCLGKDPEHGDSKNLIITFDSGDAASANAWTNVDVMQSKEEHKSLFRKVSTMMKNVRYIYRLLGTTDISEIGNGTITNAIKKLKEDQPGAATQSAAGLLSAKDKKKLDEIAEKANNYTHPPTHAANMISQDATHRFASDTEKDTWNNKLNKADVTQSTAVTVTGQKALDAIEKNAAVPGTMAYDLAQLNSNLTTVSYGAVTNIDGDNSLALVKYGRLCILFGFVKGNMTNTHKATLQYKPLYHLQAPGASDGDMTGYFSIDTLGRLYVNKTIGAGEDDSALRVCIPYIT